jgi:predicted ArsR family transcriptional regulator
MRTTSYPESPGYKATATETSRKAAGETKPTVEMQRQQCLERLRHGDLTADEVAAQLHASVLSIRPRISELNAMGRVVATEARRRNGSGKSAVVWRAVQRCEQQEFGL